MKMRWWIVGTIAAIAGGVLVVKHLTENKEHSLQCAENDTDKKYSSYPSDLYESDFEGTDFLA
jgi:hypothetical protein